MKTKVSELGEDELIARLLEGEPPPPAPVLAGPGDDCAVIRPDFGADELLLLKTDCLVEGIHFLPGTEPEKVGWKAICRVLSDFAATGGTPEHLLVTIAIDRDRAVSEVEGWYRGIRSAAARFGEIPLVGGETTSLPGDGAVLSLAMTGRVNREHFALRSGARAGDLIAVTGRLGGAFESGRHLDFLPRLAEGQWLMGRPVGQRPTAMMDLSDGLARDLPRLADRSGGLGYTIDPGALPLNEGVSPAAAAGDGEDYELLMTVPCGDASRLLEEWEKEFPHCTLTVIGEILPSGDRTPLEGGWDHFAE